MRVRRLLWTATVVLLAMAAIVRPAAAEDVDSAKQLVTTIVDDGLATFRGKQLSLEERGRLLAEKIRRYADPTRTSAQMLGRFWGRADQAMQTKFSALLVDYIVDTWSGQLSDIPASQKIAISGVETNADGVLVHTTATSDEDTPSAVDWLIARAADGRMVVTDVTVDGVSLIKTMSADFMSVLRGNGGKVDGLMDAISKKIASHATGAAPAK